MKMNTLSHVLWVALLLVAPILLSAQDCTPLTTSKSSLADLIPGDGGKITEVCQLGGAEDYVRVRVEHEGFDEGSFVVMAQSLDRNRRKLRNVEIVKAGMAKGSRSTELMLRYAGGSATAKTSFLKVVIVEADDPLADLDLSGLTLTGVSKEYKLEHTFGDIAAELAAERAKTVVNITLTPVGLAARIKQ